MAKTTKTKCPVTLQQRHEELLSNINTTLEHIKTDVATLKSITIKNGAADGTPTTFDKDDYYQMIYNAFNRLPKELTKLDDKIAGVETKLDGHVGNSFKNNIGKFNWWLNALMPIVLVALAVLYFMGLKDVKEIANEFAKFKIGIK
jgi:hypothetical protein